MNLHFYYVLCVKKTEISLRIKIVGMRRADIWRLSYLFFLPAPEPEPFILK
ncbi:hypothetical protein C2W63_03692 [Bacillus velezensis]|nr:hypothetical protein U471_08250 [Bacillus amyloliquefaciens CC178]RAP16366.1 hypothetical protein C2W63_03692 [Bacillus velezensis]